MFLKWFPSNYLKKFSFVLACGTLLFCRGAVSSSPSPVPSTPLKSASKSKVVVTNSQKKSSKKESSVEWFKNGKLPQILKEIEKKYADAKTLEATFDQTSESLTTGQSKKSSGKILVKRPGKFRWETLEPDPSQLISNGKTAWFYTPPFDESEKGQLIQRKASQVQSKLANALLSGAFSVATDMKIKAEGAFRFLLIPSKKDSVGKIKSAQIEIDPKERVIQKVVVIHEGGNKTDISLTKVKLGIDLNEELFEFTPPKNTETVKE